MGDDKQPVRYTPFVKYRVKLGVKRHGPPSTRNTWRQRLVIHKSRVAPLKAETQHAGESPQHDVQRLSPTHASFTFYRIEQGLQHDPFETLPSDAIVPDLGNAYGYLLHIWCQPREWSERPHTFIPTLIAMAKERTSLHEGIVASVLSYHEHVNLHYQKPSAALLARRSNLLKQLRQLLIVGDRESLNEAIVLIHLLLGMGASFGVTSQESRLHLEGMGHLIYRQGGINELGLEGLTQATIMRQQFFSLFALNSFDRLKGPRLRCIPVHIPALSYSYTSELSPETMLERIRCLPNGFSCLALSGELSYGLIEILIGVQTWLAGPRLIAGDTVLLSTMYQTHGLLNDIMAVVETQVALVERQLWRRQCTEAVICLALITLTANIFARPYFPHILLHLAGHLRSVVATRFWSFDDAISLTDDESCLPRKCTAWSLMLVASAADGCHSDHADDFMNMVFDLQFFDAQDYAKRQDPASHRAHSGWYRFREQVLNHFFCPDFMLDSWKNCWMKHSTTTRCLL